MIEAEQIKALQDELAALKASKAAANKLTLKVSEKGAISIYGLGRFPITMYRSQIERTFLDDGFVNGLRAFVKANAAKLTNKAS